MQKTLQFNAVVSDIEKVNPLFSKCTIRTMYAGANRNNTFISKDTTDRAIPSIYNIPIVGEFLEQKEDFGGHGGKIEISDQGIKFVQTTKPYGVVPESARVYWQPIAEADGIVNEYLVIEGAYLWTGRYAEAAEVVGNSKGQSMEIEIISGEFNKDKLFVIDEMVFSALCILGDGVEPCFESASITAYSLNKDDFKQEYTTMLKELKASLNDVDNNGKEGESMQDKLDLLSKYSVSEELVAEKGINLSEISVEDLEVQLQSFSAEVEKAPDVEDGQAEPQQEFEAEAQAEAEVVVEAEVVAEATSEDVPVEEVVEADSDFTAKEQGYLARIAELEVENGHLAEVAFALTTERDTLRTFKRQVVEEQHKIRVEELFTKFDKLEESDIAELREKMFDYSLDQIEEKLYTIYGKKAATFSLDNKKTESTIKINVDLGEAKEEPVGGYALGHLFQKYGVSK